jgi:hypothetical protein
LPLFASANKGAVAEAVGTVAMGVLHEFGIFKFVETRTRDQACIQSEGMQLGAEQESKFISPFVICQTDLSTSGFYANCRLSDINKDSS